MDQQVTRPREPSRDAADRIRRLRETTVTFLVHGDPPPAAEERLAVVSHRIDPPHGPLPAMHRRPSGPQPAIPAGAGGGPGGQSGTTFSELSAALAAETRALGAAGVPQSPLSPALSATTGRHRPPRGRLPVSQRVRVLCQSLLSRVQQPASNVGMALALVRPSEALAETGLLVELGMALAEEGRNVLLLDADFWTFELSRHFRASDENGLAEALLDRNGGPLPVLATSAAGVSLMPCGLATSGERAGIDESDWRRVMAACRESYDCVLVDAGKADAPQAVPAVRACEAAFLLFGLDELPRSAVLQTLSKLQLRDAVVTGCIVTGAPEPA